METSQADGIQRSSTGVAQLAIWTLAWLATLALARFGPELWWSAAALSWIAIIVNLIAGAGWMVAHARFLRRVDDLQRKIQLDAMAVALGVTLIGGCAYAAAYHADLVPYAPDIALVAIVMAVVYLVGIAVGTLRYR